MKNLSLFLYKKSSVWLAILATLLMVLYASLIMSNKSECLKEELKDDMSILGLKFGYNYETAFNLFSTLSNSGKICYRNLMSFWDSFFPLFYASMYIFWLSLIYKFLGKKNKNVLYLNLYPLLPAITDWIENFWEVKLLSEFINTENLQNSNVLIGSTITQIKWVFSSINYVIILTGIVLLINKKIKI